MSQAQDDYEIIGGFWWSDLTDILTCAEVRSQLQLKIDDIVNQLKNAWEAFQDTGVQTNHIWRANARRALAMTKEELRRVEIRQQELKSQNRAKSLVENGVIPPEVAHARKMERIAAANSRTQSELNLFKEEVKRRITAAEYEDIWRTVRGMLAAETDQAA